MSKDTKTFGLREEDYQLLYELQITTNNMKRHMATVLTMLARDQFGVKNTDDKMFEIDWEKKQVTVRPRENGEA